MTPTHIHRPSAALVGVFAAALLALAPLSASATILFQDNFDNGTPANSDSVPDYWTLVTPNAASSGSTVTESGGTLSIALPGSNTTDTQTRTIRSHASAPAFNFFHQPLTFSVAGFSVTNPQVGDVGAGPGNSLFQFSLSPTTESNPTSATATTDMVGLRIRASNRVELGFKQNDGSTNVFASANLAHDFTYTQAITGFSLTLDATSYSLVLTFADNSTSTSISGTHGLGLETWGSGDALGDSGIGLVTQSFLSSNKANDTLVTLDSLTVTAVPEPASTAALVGLGAFGLVTLRRRHR